MHSSSSTQMRPQSYAFLEGGGQAAQMIRDRDWSRHPLGAPDSWAPEFRTALSVVLNSPESMVLAWGPGLHFFFNDAHIPLLGSRAGLSLGARLDEVWTNAMAEVRPIIAEALAGRAKRFINMPWNLGSDRGPADTWWTFSFSRVLDAQGAAAGLFIITSDTSQSVVNARKILAGLTHQEFLLQVDHLLREMSDQDVMLDLFTERLGRHLDVDQVSYADIDPLVQFATVNHEYSAAAIPTVRGVHRIDDLSEALVTDLRTGAEIVIGNVATDVRTNDDRSLARYKQSSIAALAILPVFRSGRLRAVLALRHGAPRHWGEDEIVLARVASGRAWSSIERIRAETALAASEASFHNFAQMMPNHVWASTRTGRLTWSNDRFYDYTGAHPGKLDGMRWIKFVHPEDVPAAGKRWRQALAAGKGYATEWRLRRADGAYRWHITRATPTRGSNGEVLSWIGTNTDIEDQMGNIAELAKINQLLEQEVVQQIATRDQMWRNSRDVLAILDTDGIFQSISASVEHILGWSPDEMIGRSVLDFMLPDDKPQTVANLQTIAQGVGRVSENRYVHKAGGIRWLSWVSSLQGRLIYATGRHVTAEKEAAVKLAATQDALRQSQKMEAIGQLTGGVAHDFNNLLTPILGSLKLAQRSLAHDQRAARVMAAGVQAADRARTLVGRLLAFSRRQTLDPKSVDLTRLLMDMADLIKRSIGPEILVRFDLPASLPHVFVDANQLEMSILNISLNARDAMPSGGTLTFVASERPGADPTPPRVELAISDTGSGMDAETAARAAEPFFTTKGEGKGTGLGLSMVHGLMAQLGGAMTIQSEPGRGTAILLQMPMAALPATAPAEAASKPAERPSDADGRKILVVDDEAVVLTMTVDMLDEEGYNVTEAGSAAEALALLDAGYTPDFMVTDQSMPGMKGNELARIVTGRLGPLPILIATGYSVTRDFGFATINKPFTADELISRIRELQRGPA